ncbi:hypothetical protein F511_29384 [Dorcoceras hygrometricum]|uniref:Uncharacterized protein n=1 Tax=Dorcoceras hygrometricum TaxID=472368 RepID=A0A2Z7ADZ0_9LAMI|nr:hypothetical protein F511_29384 [Dorcoceras hygrometricum]
MCLSPSLAPGISVLGKTESELIDSVLADDLDEVSEWIKYINQLVGNQLGIEQSWSLEAAQKLQRTEQAQLQTKRDADAGLLKNRLKMKSNQLDEDTSWRTRSGQNQLRQTNQYKQAELDVSKGCRFVDEKSSSQIKPATHQKPKDTKYKCVRRPFRTATTLCPTDKSAKQLYISGAMKHK